MDFSHMGIAHPSIYCANEPENPSEEEYNEGDVKIIPFLWARECPNLVACCNECNMGKRDTMFCQILLDEIKKRIIYNEEVKS